MNGAFLGGVFVFFRERLFPVFTVPVFGIAFVVSEGGSEVFFWRDGVEVDFKGADGWAGAGFENGEAKAGGFAGGNAV